jgi:catechol 2,3-dioxygenase-like lactoylglutathione lyase family enzyme
MINGVRHTGIVVKDIEGAINFWVGLLGFNIVSSEIETGNFIDRLLGLEDVKVQTFKLVARDQTMIELLHFETHPSEELWNGTPYSNGLTHVALNTSQLTTLVAKLSAQGFHPVNDIEVAPNGKVRVCYLSGFEGVLLELVEPLTV